MSYQRVFAFMFMCSVTNGVIYKSNVVSAFTGLMCGQGKSPLRLQQKVKVIYS